MVAILVSGKFGCPRQEPRYQSKAWYGAQSNLHHFLRREVFPARPARTTEVVQSGGLTCIRMLLAGIEPASPPSEGDILSIELQKRQASRTGIH